MDWLNTLKGITEGVLNSIFVKEEVEKVAEERINICRQCPHNSNVRRANGEKMIRPDEFCGQCGCDLYLKTRALNQQCPLDKWLALTDENTAYEIEQKIK